VLPVPAIDDARAKGGEDACERKKRGGEGERYEIRGCFCVPSILRTETARGEAVEKAIAPVALPIRADCKIQSVLVATCGHRGGALQNTQTRKQEKRRG
jgi:hypothetical protein